jgi:hypothetical protein
LDALFIYHKNNTSYDNFQLKSSSFNRKLPGKLNVIYSVQGVISPMLANLTLDGLEAATAEAAHVTSHGYTRQRHWGYYQPSGLHVIRYADDVRHITWRWPPSPGRRGTEMIDLWVNSLPNSES